MSIRLERLKEVIREVSANVILHELQDPRIGFCTVTHVDLSKDLSAGTIYVSIFGDEAQKRTTLRGLKEARGVIQSRVAGAMHTRMTPKLSIVEDDSIDRSFRILEKIKEARASDPDGGKGSPGMDQIPEEESTHEQD